MAAPDPDEATELDARDGIGSVFGKFTEPVKTHLDEFTYDRWLRLCADRRQLPGVVLRDLIYLVVHGQTPAELEAQRSRGLLTAEGLNQVRERIGGGA